MPLNKIELLKAAEVVAQKQDMKVALKYSATAAGATGMTTLVGGLLAGPVGLFIGGALGGLGSMIATNGKFKPVVVIIRNELNESDKEKLACHIRNAIRDFDVLDFAFLITRMASTEAITLAIMGAIKTFIENDMRLSLI